jgi:hypothetical protein
LNGKRVAAIYDNRLRQKQASNPISFFFFSFFLSKEALTVGGRQFTSSIHYDF